jgi:hypothetical protein
VRIAVEETVAEDHVHPRLGDHVGEPLSLVDRVRGEVEVAEMDALEELEREHPRA